MKTLALISGIVAAVALTSCTRNANNADQPTSAPTSQPNNTGSAPAGTGGTAVDGTGAGMYDSGPADADATDDRGTITAPSGTSSGTRATENP